MRFYLLDSVEHNSKFDEDHLRFRSMFISGVMEKSGDGSEFYRQLKNLWENAESFDKNKSIYRDFFDENNNYIPRPSELLRLKTMKELQSKLDSATINNFWYSAYVYHFNHNKVYEIDYDINREQFLILALEVDDSQKNGEHNMELFLVYKILVDGKQKLPYVARGIKFLIAAEITTGKLEEVIQYLSK